MTTLSQVSILGPVNGRGPEAKRCDRCGGILSDRRRKRHEDCEAKALADDDKTRPCSFGLYPRQIAKLERLAAGRGSSKSKVVQDLIDGAEEA